MDRNELDEPIKLCPREPGKVIWERVTDVSDDVPAGVRLICGGFGLDVHVWDPRDFLPQNAVEIWPPFRVEMQPTMLVGPNNDEIRSLIESLVNWYNDGLFDDGPVPRLYLVEGDE